MAALAAGIGAGMAYIGCVLCCRSIESYERRKQAHQQEDVFNISSRVQGQEHQWPTHDAHLSIDHITILNQMNKPPKYEDDPPSYEEAIRIAALNQQSGSSTIPSVIVVAPKPINTH